MKKQEDTANGTGGTLMKDQERGKEVRARFFSGHVAQATHFHEQVTKNAPLLQEDKEAPGHQ